MRGKVRVEVRCKVGVIGSLLGWARVLGIARLVSVVVVVVVGVTVREGWGMWMLGMLRPRRQVLLMKRLVGLFIVMSLHLLLLLLLLLPVHMLLDEQCASQESKRRVPVPQLLENVR